MPKSVFYSFHYERDNWRVNQVINMGVLENQPILTAQDWESVKEQGDAAIEQWIADQMSGKSAVVVLVGAQTARRPWVDYEIRKAWSDKRPLVGVRINGLADQSQNTDPPGDNPFGRISMQGGGTMADYVTLHNPAGSDSKAVHASIRDNLAGWVDRAYRPS